MIPLALEKAKSRLRSAANSLEALRGAAAADADINVSDHWVDFLVHWKATYSKIQQAAKQTPQEVQWFGAVNAERRNDPLLRYLFEARNDEEHGLVESVERDLGVYAYRATLGVGGLRIGPGPDGGPQISDGNGDNNAQLLRKVGGGISLKPVTERDGKKKVLPPETHFGEPIDSLPIPVAEAGYRYIEALVAVAEAMDES